MKRASRGAAGRRKQRRHGSYKIREACPPPGRGGAGPSRALRACGPGGDSFRFRIRTRSRAWEKWSVKGAPPPVIGGGVAGANVPATGGAVPSSWRRQVRQARGKRFCLAMPPPPMTRGGRCSPGGGASVRAGGGGTLRGRSPQPRKSPEGWNRRAPPPQLFTCWERASATKPSPGLAWGGPGGGGKV